MKGNNLKETESVLLAVKTEAGAQEKDYVFIRFKGFPHKEQQWLLFTWCVPLSRVPTIYKFLK